MPDSKPDMEQELKATVVPWLRATGFKGSPPHFRRRGQSSIDLLTFQFDQHGGGFVIEIAQCPIEGIVTHWGKAIPPEKARAWDVHPSRRKRIQYRDTPGTEGWFRFDKLKPRDLANQVLISLADQKLWSDLGPIGSSNQLQLPA